ncbi:DUF6950 family protein [Cupriavidus basilensis]|uniref:DUF6950 family protein n=1 Tax=Cupriavidus basilensis TaxID=68895 RepID=UPI0020A6BAE0|nr:hypothetical protein [Cupriavidus basilensis]MCP3022310.1 hypothetical protein [Cupriavidus basilensis]
MQRLEDWPTRLAEFIEARQERAFSWGKSDCSLFVCDAIEAMTGTDPGARWRGIYSTEKGARRVLRDNDGVVGIATLVLGPPVPPALAARGDVVLVDTLQGEALGICLGSQIAAQGPDGIVFLPIGRGTRAWHV